MVSEFPHPAVFALGHPGDATLSSDLASYIFDVPRKKKRRIQIAADVGLIVFALLAALCLRFDAFTSVLLMQNWLIGIPVALICTFCFLKLGYYNNIVRFENSAGNASNFALKIGTVWALFMVISLYNPSLLPRSVPFITALILSVGWFAMRWIVHTIYLATLVGKRRKAIIYGAGTSGRQLANSLASNNDYKIVGMVDDDRELEGLSIAGLRVSSPTKLAELIENNDVERIFLAMPSLAAPQRQAILKELEPLPVKVKTVPSVDELISGRVSIDDTRDLQIEDLLGRVASKPLPELLSKNTSDKTILVSGAGGSIGSEICRKVLLQKPQRIILFEQSELALYTVELSLQKLRAVHNIDTKIEAILGSVQDETRLRHVFRSFSVDTVYHAAAYKHVPLIENNSVEGLRNNVFGTLALVRMAQEFGVAHFTLISTDKAVRPTNIMGASKRLAELICQAYANDAAKNASVDGAVRTRFAMVRFGNVLGSSGSVIPLFRKQIDEGGPVTVTHPKINRFFMTIEEAALLVIQSCAMARGGDVFLLDMGEPVEIVKLAQRVISLSGYQPRMPDSAAANDPLQPHEIEIRFTGLRPGEKLYEELLVAGEEEETRHPSIRRSNEPFLEREVLESHLQELENFCTSNNFEGLVEKLLSLPLEYRPD